MTTTPPGTGLGPAIRTWRNRLAPSAAGLPVVRKRRAVGLRREELADLAGVSVDYVVRLEQGRATTPSESVVASLARAPQLSTAERDHLYRLAQIVPPADVTICDHLPSGMQRVLVRLGDVPVAVFAADWQLVWWNHGWAALLGDPLASPPRMRNFARDRFPVGADHTPLVLWPLTDTDPDTTDAALVSDQSAGNERFAELWATGEVTANREVRKTVDHPSVGPVTVDCDVLTDGDTELKIVIMTATPGSEDETKLQLTTAVGPPAGTRN
ncbi:helix-turn-helix transcriptional regulator [Nonomuraea fuscirosea]|uniref:helix-turn-helix transcriptional regulator n=1 Tax=Nonomuraea fuscirosea TaxID=1291556 RepID=UPI0034151B18